MAVSPVTPVPGSAFTVAVAGTPVLVAPGGIGGGFIVNPSSALDQGLDPLTQAPQFLYVDPVGNATLNGNNTTFALAPGQSWPMIPGQTTPTSVNAPLNGQKFSVVYWPNT